jgi:hypothetical protein
MAAGFIFNSSRKELLMEFIATILTSWKLLSRKKNYLNEWNERVAKAKLDVFHINYFAKQKRHRVKKEFLQQ